DAESLLGPVQSGSRMLAERLCRSGHAHAIAFDAAAGKDASELAGPESAAAAGVGRPRARWLVSSAPGAIVAGQELPPLPETQAGNSPGSTDPADTRLPVALKLS